MQEHVTPFDLNRMFLGEPTSWFFLAEVLVRTIILFSWALVNIRLLGKRNLGQLSPFQLLITIALGSAVGDPMFYHDVPILPAMLAISVVIFLEKSLTWLTLRNEALEQYVEGRAALVIDQGRICCGALDENNMPKDELLARLRGQGISHIGQVEKAYLERAGTLSVLQYTKPPRTGEHTAQLPKEKKLSAGITQWLSSFVS